MKVVWTPRAEADLDDTVSFIARDKPSSAMRVVQRISDLVSQLEHSPYMGRQGEKTGTRELVFAPWPYIAVYRVTADRVLILRVRHAKRASII